MFEVITKELVQNILPKRNPVSNKGDFGKVLNIVGSEKYLGAGVLASLSSLKVGVGYSIFCSCDNVIKNCLNFSPDLVYKSHNDFDADLVQNILERENISSVVLGCGISTSEKVIAFVDRITDFIKGKNIKCIIDADGLNCLALLNKTNLGNNFILTPHPKELARLMNVEVDEVLEKREYYAHLAQEKFNANIVLKGHDTLIATTDKILYKNVTGNSALAKAGTGDVLAGMIGGFLAQKCSLQDAGILAVYIHGLAAEIYSNEYSEYSMLASDLLNYIPVAIKLCK